MTIRVQCNCGQIYDLGDEMAGQQAQCQVCNMVFLVPGAQPSAPQPNSPAHQNQASFPQQNQHIPQQQIPQQPVPGAQQQQPMGFQQAPAGYPAQHNMAGQQPTKGIAPKTWAIIGGSAGGLLILIIIIVAMSSGSSGNNTANNGSTKEQSEKSKAISATLEQNKRAAGNMHTSMPVRIITCLISALVGASLCFLGARDFITKKAEEMGNARKTNNFFGISNHYVGRKAEWVGVLRIIFGVLAITFGIYFFVYGAI